MDEALNPQELFESFEVFNLVKPMAGTFHVVDLTLSDTELLLERKKAGGFKNLHDAAWLKHMSMTMLFAMTQNPQPIFGFSTANSISILYKVLPKHHSGTELISTATSATSSFLGTRVDTTVRFTGTLMEFPNPKILTAFYLWKQNQNRERVVADLCQAALISAGSSAQEAQETIASLPDFNAKISVITEFLNEDPIAPWRTNGVASYWVPKEEGIRLTLHQELPAGPDFLTFMIEIFDQE